MVSRRSIVRLVEQLFAVLLLIAIAAGPSLAAFAQLNTSQCSMSCCRQKRSTTCCKHHAHTRSSHDTPVLKVDTSCAAGCAVTFASPAAVVALELPEIKLFVPRSEPKRLMPPARAPAARSAFSASLYQRPPPDYLL